MKGSLTHKGKEIFVQKDLANTLLKIADSGPAVFYIGSRAKKIIADIPENGGVYQYKDLANYEAYT